MILCSLIKDLQRVLSIAEEQLSFLVQRLDDVTEEREISRVLKTLPDFPDGLISDVFILRDTVKYTSRGQTMLLELDSSYKREGVFTDTFGNVCFVKEGTNGFYVIRLSLSSLALALNVPSVSFASTGANSGPKSIQISQNGWLELKENKAPFLRIFADKYFWLIVSLPLVSVFIMGSCLVLYLWLFLVTHRKHRRHINTIENELNILRDDNLALTIDNQKMTKISAALKQKQKIQADLYQKYVQRRQNLAGKISDISRFVSRSFIDSGEILENQEFSKLLIEISKSSKILSDGLFEMKIEQKVSLSDCLKQIKKYLTWSLLKAGVSLIFDEEQECFLKSDELGIKLLLINILLRHIGRAYEGAIVVCRVIQTKEHLDIIISCEKSLQTERMLGTDNHSNPLIFSDEVLPKLADVLELAYTSSALKTTKLTYHLIESVAQFEGVNVVQMFR